MQASARKIVVLGTGGTIAGVAASASDSRNYVAAQKPVTDLLAGLPVPGGCEVVSEQVAQIDSKDMGLEVWQALVRRCRHWLADAQVAGLVITHGTDTLEETAFLLHRLLAPGKPVVLTCAMRPATAIDADGPRNLLDAMWVACCPEASGVVAVCAGRIHDPRELQKVHSWRPDAFSSGDAGDIGAVRNGEIVRWREWPQGEVTAADEVERFLAAAALPDVEIVLSHATASGALVDALLQPGVLRPAGLVLAGTGGGTVHRQLEAALRRARAAGLRIVRTSRCTHGHLQVQPGAEFPVAEGLSPVKARLSLMLDLLDAVSRG